MRWDLQELKNNVKILHGEEQKNILSPCLESLIDRKYYARYHFQEFERLLKEFLVDKEDQTSLFKLVFGVDKEEGNSFYNCRKMAEAHVVACLQSMHAISDTLSHVIYYALNMKIDSDFILAERKISMHNVRVSLEKRSEYNDFLKLINNFINHSDYKYLGGIVNHSKHRSIIGTSFTVDASGMDERPHGLKFLSFEYDQRPHSSRWVDIYIANEYKRQDPLVIKIGNELNHLLREKVLTTRSSALN